VDELSSIQNGTSLVMGVGSLTPTLMTRPRGPLSRFRLISPPWSTKPDCPSSIKHHPSLPSTRSASQIPNIALLNFQAFFSFAHNYPSHLSAPNTFPTTFTFRYLLKETKHSSFRGPFQEKTMFSMKTHKVVLKTIHQHILSHRHPQA
jgi:hypothetical protein